MRDVPPLGDDLSALGCAALVDAMGRLHRHRAHILPLTSPDPGRPLFGPVATIAFMPWRDDLAVSSGTFADFFYRALGNSPRGKVLVLSSGGHPEASHGGGTKLLFELVFEDDDAAGGLDGGALVDELASPGGDAQLIAGVTAVAALGAQRSDQAVLAESSEEGGGGAEHLGGPAHRVGGGHLASSTAHARLRLVGRSPSVDASSHVR
ncbi:hypothetical protein SVIRM249S_07021 [Streptomyces viridochromogenes]